MTGGEKVTDYCKCWQLVVVCLPPREGSVSPILFVKVAGEELQCERRDAKSEIFLMTREGVDEYGKRRIMTGDDV